MILGRAICALGLVLLFGASSTVPAQNNPVPNSPDRDRGNELYRQGKFAEAANLLKKVVKKAKTDDTVVLPGPVADAEEGFERRHQST